MAFLKVETLPLFPKVRTALEELLSDLRDDEWALPTVCEGWDVKDVALHLLPVRLPGGPGAAVPVLGASDRALPGEAVGAAARPVRLPHHDGAPKRVGLPICSHA